MIIYILEAQCTKSCVGGVGPAHPNHGGSCQAGGGEGMQEVGQPALPPGQTSGLTPCRGHNLPTSLLLYRIPMDCHL